MIKKTAIIAICLAFSATAAASSDGSSKNEEPLTVGIAEPMQTQQADDSDSADNGDPSGLSVYDGTQWQGSTSPASQSDTDHWTIRP